MNKEVLILGATGMLGAEVLKSFQEESKFKIYASYRKKKYLKYLKNKNTTFFQFDVEKLNILKKFNKKNLIIINCIGIIKPFINESVSKTILSAINVNSFFPYFLKETFLNSKKNNIIYQIATDCVYSGNKGNYNENSAHDCTDIYGKTKSLGEVKNKNFYNLRCSIIGPEIKNKVSLLEWFKSQKKGSELTGFGNHYWNGLTTKAFSIALKSIIINKTKIPHNLHLVPMNRISKYNLLVKFKKKYSRFDLKIKKINHSSKINRTLSTNNKKINKIIWKKSKYRNIPTIEKMINEI